MADKTLDARGMPCPLPILKARKAILDVPVGAMLTVLATDRGAPKDFEVFAATTGHALIDVREEGGVFTFVLRRGAG